MQTYLRIQIRLVLSIDNNAVITIRPILQKLLLSIFSDNLNVIQ